jgi:hypothetical protein
MTPLRWPDYSSEFWWMRYRPRINAAFRLALVTRDDKHDVECVREFQDTRLLSREEVQPLLASFLPAVSPPVQRSLWSIAPSESTPTAERSEPCQRRDAGGVSSLF